MALKEYEVTLDGGRKTTLRLSDEDARRRGLTAKQQPAPKNKQRTTKNKATS